MKTRVVHCKKEPFDVLIDRTTILGNPYTLKTYTREEAINLYRYRLFNSPELIELLKTIQGKVLGCWCKPLPCHGDVLAEVADLLYDS